MIVNLLIRSSKPQRRAVGGMKGVVTLCLWLFDGGDCTNFRQPTVRGQGWSPGEVIIGGS